MAVRWCTRGCGRTGRPWRLVRRLGGGGLLAATQRGRGTPVGDCHAGAPAAAPLAGAVRLAAAPNRNRGGYRGIGVGRLARPGRRARRDAVRIAGPGAPWAWRACQYRRGRRGQPRRRVQPRPRWRGRPDGPVGLTGCALRRDGACPVGWIRSARRAAPGSSGESVRMSLPRSASPATRTASPPDGPERSGGQPQGRDPGRRRYRERSGCGTDAGAVASARAATTLRKVLIRRSAPGKPAFGSV